MARGVQSGPFVSESVMFFGGFGRCYNIMCTFSCRFSLQARSSVRWNRRVFFRECSYLKFYAVFSDMKMIFYSTRILWLDEFF